MARVAERLSEQLERQLASHPLDVLVGGQNHRLVKPRVVLAETSPHSEMIQLDCVFPHPLIWHCSPRSWAGGSNSQFSKRRGFDVLRFQKHTETDVGSGAREAQRGHGKRLSSLLSQPNRAVAANAFSLLREENPTSTAMENSPS